MTHHDLVMNHDELSYNPTKLSVSKKTFNIRLQKIVDLERTAHEKKKFEFF